LNSNPDKGKAKPPKPSKREVERLIKAAILAEFTKKTGLRIGGRNGIEIASDETIRISR